MNGQLVDWESATVHVMAHALHYGTSVFEGVRSYETPQGPQIFRLESHTRRLLDSAKLYRIPVKYTADELNEACKSVIRENGVEQCLHSSDHFSRHGYAGCFTRR